MADKFPAYVPSDNGAYADLYAIWKSQALLWGQNKGEFDRKLKAIAPYVYINGIQCYSNQYAFDYHDIGVPSNNGPATEWLRLLGMTDEEIHQLWLDGLDPSEVDTLWLKWKDPEVKYSQDSAN